jgi:pimeloyl-ACP methyl ester carboxylesterase
MNLRQDAGRRWHKKEANYPMKKSTPSLSRLVFVLSIPTLALLLVASGLLGDAASAFAQEAKGKAEEPAIEDIELETKDKVELKLRYYHGTNGEESVPIMIVHDWEGQASDYNDLAKYLQKQGYAVIVPDLRGHGGTVTFNIRDPKSRTGDKLKLEVDKFKTEDLVRMVKIDMEAVKGFITSRNNERELNVDKLCVIGVGVGSLLALNWAVEDWSWPILARGKQGQDVKALVLVSPQVAYQRIDFERAVNHKDVRARLSVLIAYGEDDQRSKRASEAIYGRFLRYHPEPPEEDAQKLKSLFKFSFATKLQGDKLIKQGQFQIPEIINQFVQARVASKEFPWSER